MGVVATKWRSSASGPADVRESAPQIPRADMRGIRNVVAHRYFGGNLPILWEMVQNDVPPLLEPLRGLRGDTPADE